MTYKFNHLLILGANSDIAEQVAYQAAKERIALTLSGRNFEKLKALQSDIQAKHEVTVYIRKFDAGKINEHQSFYDGLDEKPDAVLCAFGILGDQKLAEKDESWQNIIQTNFTGAVSILSIIANDFEKRKHGFIAGISSVAGDRGRQSNYFYGAAKAGFTTFLSGLRNRMQHCNVSVLTVKPGFVKTKMIDGLETPGP
ncbi:SDR family NAD(P)-dependent oxidoreductase [Marivirga harenae]|uniref:SDR family NAD(P)-dependent oxidoreductase n=1 Tax=Marivirga harenae TaxID=2010992 RepID=UPI0026DEEBEF|nr:SDR family NAD(P)-dependent oxidoreductase [Marivirga harenae]WKV12897.1 SDR family NAD(P)-dependent oxidoreductase [Marivirga harenae]